MGAKSKLEERFYRAWKKRFPGLPKPKRQLRFHPTRRWRFDFSWPKQKLAVEIQGGSFMFGGHNRGMGQAKDYEKQREAVRLGWRVLPFGTADFGKINSGKIWDVVTCVAEILTDAKEVK